MGPGKEFIPSEVPTLQTIIQRGILIRDRMLLEQGSAKKMSTSKILFLNWYSLIVAQWQISNAKFAPPVTIKEGSIRAKVDRLWGKVEEVKHGRAGKGKGGGKGKGTMERDKVELLLDKLVDINTCPHSIQLCNDPGSGCKDGCSLLSMVNETPFNPGFMALPGGEDLISIPEAVLKTMSIDQRTCPTLWWRPSRRGCYPRRCKRYFVGLSAMQGLSKMQQLNATIII